MANKIIIEVTPEDIAFAQQQNKGNCAVARAIKRAGWEEYSTGGGKPGFTVPKVDADKIAFTDEEYEQRFTFRTPPKVAAFVDAFDRNRDAAKPFSFTLDYDDDTTKAKPKKHASPTEYIDKNRSVGRRASYERQVAAAREEGRNTSTIFRALR